MKNGTKIQINLVTEMVQDGEKESHKFDVEGQGVIKNQSLYLLYEETHQLSGEELVTVPVMIKITDDGIVGLTRTANGQKSKMTFDQSKTTITHYQTPYGLMALDVSTQNVEHLAEEEGLNGSLNVAYQLTAEQGVLGSYQMKLNYQEITK